MLNNKVQRANSIEESWNFTCDSKVFNAFSHLQLEVEPLEWLRTLGRAAQTLQENWQDGLWLHLTHSVFILTSLPESPGEEMDYPMFISIGDWLDSIKMSQYKSNFMAAGYNTLDSVARMSIE